MTKPLNEEQVAALGREKEQERWELPERFRLTAELMDLPIEELRKRDPEKAKLREQVEQQQKAWAEVNVAGTPSVQDVWRARSVQVAEELRIALVRLKQQRDAVVAGSGDGDLVELQAAILALRERRAEALAEIGRFDLAASVTPIEARRDGYLAILDAIDRPDDEAVCECPPHRGSGSGPNAALETTRHYVRKEIFSPKHGQVVFLLACANCGAMNATTELPKQIAEQRSHRARAHQLAGHLSPSDAARTLTSQGHTSAKLLK